MGNRLYYGNFIDGYDFKRNSSEGSDISLDYSTSYISKNLNIKALPPGVPTTGSPYTINPSATTFVENSKVRLDLTDVADKLKKGSLISFSFNITHDQINGTTSTTCYGANNEFKNANFNLQLSITLNQDYATPYTFLTSSQFQDAIGTGTLAEGRFLPILDAQDGNSLTDLFNNALVTPAEQCVFVKSNSSINDATQQQGFNVLASPGNSQFDLQILAMKYTSTDLNFIL